MQIYGIRSKYMAALKKAVIIQRPEISAQGVEENSTRVSLSEDSLFIEAPLVTRHGLSALSTPDDPSLHRQVAHQAGHSYADEARIAHQIKNLKRALSDIHRLQNLSVQLGPAVYA